MFPKWNGKNFSQLFLLRVLAVGIRPFGIALEGILLSSSDLLVTLFPLVGLIILCSAVPTHLEYYKLQSSHDQNGLARLYLQQLVIVTGLVVILCSVVFIFLGMLISAFFLCFLLFYLLEKVTDELLRKYEFQRRMYVWFLLQFSRSTWVILPIILAYYGTSYELSFIAFGLIVLIVTFIFFLREFPLLTLPSRDSFRAVSQKFVYLLGNFTIGSYRQGPRLYVVSSFPEFAHVYMVISQTVQVLNIAYNTKLQIPYRKMIARKTRLVFNRVRRVNWALITGVVFVSCVFLIIPYLENPNPYPLLIVSLLIPILACEAIMVAILAAMVGYIQWGLSMRGFVIAFAYLIFVVGAIAILFILTDLDLLLSANILYLPALNCLFGALLFLCLAEIYRKLSRKLASD